MEFVEVERLGFGVCGFRVRVYGFGIRVSGLDRRVEVHGERLQGEGFSL